MAPPTNRESDKFIVRLPDGMRDRIKTAAEANNRSMNAEIVARLDASFDEMPEVLSDYLENRAQKLQLEIRAQRAEARTTEERIKILEHKLIEIVTKIEEREDKDKRRPN